MVLVTIVLYPLLFGGLSRPEGVLLFSMLVGFVIFLIRDPSSAHDYAADAPLTPRPPWMVWLMLLLGIAALVGGAQTLVSGAVRVAETLGVPDRVIGLTLVAFGTSLPELATSLVAARRGQSDLVLGNVVGSNIFNLLCILGLTSIVHPIAVDREAINLDFWVMLAISVFTAVVIGVDQRIGRINGGLLFAAYLSYVVVLFVL